MQEFVYLTTKLSIVLDVSLISRKSSMLRGHTEFSLNIYRVNQLMGPSYKDRKTDEQRLNNLP